MSPQARDVQADELDDAGRQAMTTQLFAGDVFVVRDALRHLGCLETLVDASLAGVEQAAGKDVAARVKSTGLDRLHEIVPESSTPAVMRAATTVHERIAIENARRICTFLFGRRRFYLEMPPNVRMHVPYDRSRSIANVDSFEYSGKITPHGPHHDSWYQCPTNCLDVWMALGPVVRGNGLSIFPEVWGKYLPCNTKGVIRRDQAFGRPINFEMAPGDVLVFRGEHLHGSEINSSPITRHVVSYRVALGRPQFVGNSPSKFTYAIVPPEGAAAALIEYGDRVVRGARGAVARRLGRLNTDRWVISAEEHPAFDDLADRREPLEGIEEILADVDARAGAIASRMDLPVGAVRPVSDRLCAARGANGDVTVLGRTCPHQGGDLALGTVEGSTLYCPWHNLPINLRTGESPCRTLRRVDVVRRWSSGS